MDDIPIQLCPTYGAALLVAHDVDKPNHPVNPDYWDTDASTPCSVAIVTFDDAGTPTSVEVVRSLE
jgi:hypothetical protein